MSPSSSMPLPLSASSLTDLLAGLLDVHSSHCVAASRLLLCVVLLAAAFMGQGAWAFLTEMGQHALAAQPKAIDYLAHPRQQPAHARVHPQGRQRPNNSWALPSAEEEMAMDVDLDSLLNTNAPQRGSAPSYAHHAPRRPEQELDGVVPQQPPARPVVCNLNLPRSPVAAF